MIRQESLAPPLPSLSGLRARPLLATTTLAVLILTALWLPSLAGARWYSDEGVFAAVAQAWRGGATLYDGTWDNKPPLIFLTYASAQAVFGDTLVAPRALALLAAAGAVAITVALGSRLYGHARGAFAGILAAGLLGSPVIEGNLALTETFMVFPAAAGVLTTVAVLQRDGAANDARARRLLLAAGLSFGLAMGYKQVAVFDLAAAALLLLLLHPRPLRALSPLLAGAMIPQLAFLLFFAATGAGSGYLYAVVGSMPEYAAAVVDPKPLWATLVGYVPLVFALAAAAWMRRSFDLRAFPAIWFAFAFAGAASSPYSFPHYLAQAAVPCALCVAMMSSPPPPLRRSSLLAAAPAAVAIVTAASALAVFGPEIGERRQSSPRWYYNTALEYARGDLSRAEYEGRMDGAALAVRDIAAAMDSDGRGTTLFQWADFPWLYSVAGARNPTPYATPWLVQWVPGARDDVIAALEATPPSYLVISANVDPFPALEAIAARDYDLVRAENDWRLYGLADAR